MAASATSANSVSGRTGVTVEVYASSPQDTPEVMAASLVGARGEGFRRIQPKTCGEPDLGIARVPAEGAPTIENGTIRAAAGGWARFSSRTPFQS